MIVYCNIGFSNDIQEKKAHLIQFVDGLLYYFQNLTFGEDVEEIAFYAASGDSMFMLSYGEGLYYKRKKKVIGGVLKINFDRVKVLEKAALCAYFAEQLIEEIKKISELNVKKFDLNGFILKLEEYFKEAIELIKIGKDMSEGQTLNEDIKIKMQQKFSNL